MTNEQLYLFLRRMARELQAIMERVDGDLPTDVSRNTCKNMLTNKTYATTATALDPLKEFILNLENDADYLRPKP